MSTIKVDTIQSRQHSSSTISLTSTGATVNGDCTATTFSGSGASLTSLPAANLTGVLPAIDGSNLSGVGGGGFDFVKKITTSSAVTYIDETGLDYDRLYRFVLKTFTFSGIDTLHIRPIVDNMSTPNNTVTCQGNTLAHGPTNYQTGGYNNWRFNNGGYSYTRQAGYFDIYTTDEAWVLGNINSYPSMFGPCLLWGSVQSKATNTNNDPNQTGTYSKINGLRFESNSGAVNIGTDLEILVYKYKES